MPLRIVSADGDLLGEFGEERRAVVRIQDVPPLMKNAILAAEDERFYQHNGLDPLALLRAVWQVAANGRVVSGGSTLTMQVARLLEESGTGRLSGKLRQIRVALALERRLTKDEILDLYLRLAPYGGNLEGAYWHYEMKVRELESGLAGVTAGNGAIYAVRASSYIPLKPSGSHDLSFPFAFAKKGMSSLYRPKAAATEKMVPSLDGELSRKRRMMVGLWDIIFGEGMLDLRGYRPAYIFELFSHRVLRYASPVLHLVALVTNLILLGQHEIYTWTLVLQLALLLAAVLGRWIPVLPLRIARYYVETTLSIALGFWDRWRGGPPGYWEKAEGTR